jgi:copper(I)-binding protein
MHCWIRGQIFAATLGGALVLAACAESAPPRADVQVEGAWVRAVVGPDANSAAYMTLHNRGTVSDRLVGGRSGAARMAELHRTQIDSAGLARMGRVEALDLPAGGTVLLEPGGYHLMLMGVGTLVEGDAIELTLVLAGSDPIQVEAEVRAF